MKSTATEVKFTPTKEKCSDPETGKICSGLERWMIIPGIYSKEGICLIKKNMDQMKPPIWCKNPNLNEAHENGT